MTSILHTPKAAALVRNTLQPLSPNQVVNNSGAFVFQISDLDRFKRFLIIGTDGGTYYESEKELTASAVNFVKGFVAEFPQDAADAIAWGAKNAPKRTYSLYALAALASVPVTGCAAASTVIQDVIGNGTDLLEFVAYADQMRGWGRGLKNLVGNFLETVDGDRLGLWAIKYRNRHGWTWADVLRKTHPVSAEKNDLFAFMAGKDSFNLLNVPNSVIGFKLLQETTDESAVREIVGNLSLPWEALSDEQRTDALWTDLVVNGNLGNVAMLRNLANLTRKGVLAPFTPAANAATAQLRNAKNLHPLKVLEASRVYGGASPIRGYSGYGSSARKPQAPFKPVPAIQEALEAALVNAFTRGVPSTGKAIYYAVDVSGSMGAPYSGSDYVTCCEAAAALALGSAKNETNTIIKGFTRGSGGYSYSSRSSGTEMTDLGITASDTFASATQKARYSNFGGTDASLPIRDAIAHGYKVDAFVVITDNETNGGTAHPMQALRDYRSRFNPKAKLIVIGMTATPFSIADPSDPACLNIAGFSADTPAVIASFMEA